LADLPLSVKNTQIISKQYAVQPVMGEIEKITFYTWKLCSPNAILF